MCHTPGLLGPKRDVEPTRPVIAGPTPCEDLLGGVAEVARGRDVPAALRALVLVEQEELLAVGSIGVDLHLLSRYRALNVLTIIIDHVMWSAPASMVIAYHIR